MNSRERLHQRTDAFLRCRAAEDSSRFGALRSILRPALTISRETGARGLAIGEAVVDYLDQFDETAEHGWALFDQGLVAETIEDRHFRNTTRTLPEGDAGAMHEAVAELFEQPESEWSLFQHTAATIRHLCTLGNVVIVGRGANFISQDLPHTFHVRLVGSETRRAEHLSRVLKLSAGDALRYARQRDEARQTYIRRHFDRNVAETATYHLVLNTDRFDDEIAARIVGDTLLEWAGMHCLTAESAAV